MKYEINTKKCRNGRDVICLVEALTDRARGVSEFDPSRSTTPWFVRGIKNESLSVMEILERHGFVTVTAEPADAEGEPDHD